MTQMLVLDARGLSCPMPLLKLKQQLSQMGEGDCIDLIATDAGTLLDIPAFAQQAGHLILEQNQHNGEFRFIIKKVVV